MTKIARTAYELLKRLEEEPRQLRDDENAPSRPMLNRFTESEWATREDTLAPVESGTGTYGRYTIAPHGLRMLRTAEVVDDNHPEAVGLR